VVFQLNSVDITLGSTAYFQAVPSRELVASVIEGEARLTSQGISKTVPAGLRSTVPLDDAGAAAGPPGEPELYNPAELIRLPVANLARDVEIASPLFLTTFGAGAEDWGLADGEAVELAHFTDDLNGNGILCGTEQDGDDSIWYFAAPPIWLEDLEDAYGGNLIYGQNQGVVDNQLDQSEKVLLIASDGTAIAYNAGENPAADYTVYTVPLNEGAGWLHPGTNIRVTEREFRKILADLGALRILGEHRRGENTSCLDFVLVNQAVQAELSDAPSEPIRASGFEEDAEGWSTNEGGSTPIEYVEAGYVCGTDQDFLDAWYFIAPDIWLGDQSAAYGGYLLFELNQSATDGIQNNVPYNVALIGSGMSLQYRAVGNPSTEFTRYIVPLIEFEGWLKAGREAAPTQSEMVEVLSNLQELRIIAEFRGDEDTGCLNRAELYSPGARVYQ
jgi:hypothetical protein